MNYRLGTPFTALSPSRRHTSAATGIPAESPRGPSSDDPSARRGTSSSRSFQIFRRNGTRDPLYLDLPSTPTRQTSTSPRRTERRSDPRTPRPSPYRTAPAHPEP